MTSRPPSSKTSMAELMFARILRCDSITPFGTPVLPLEKMTVASESASFSRTNSRSIAAAGNSDVATAMPIFASVDVGLRQEHARGENRADAAAVDRSDHRVAARREIQIDGNFPGDRRPDIGERATHRGGQQEADEFFAASP